MSTQLHIEKLIRLAREHVARRVNDPVAGDADSPEAYFEEIHSEIDEAKVEVKENNAIHLEDELGDIFWDYCLLLSYLESHNYIDSVESVLQHALEKFIEREPGMKARSSELWNEIKQRQKAVLLEKHSSRYSKS